MTMCHERTRALRWGFEILQEICDGAVVKGSERAKAAELLLNYPTPATVAGWIQSDASCIPASAARAIEATGELLRFIRCSGTVPTEMRHSALFALRHFPEPGSAERWTRSSPNWSIRTWLLPEDVYG